MKSLNVYQALLSVDSKEDNNSVGGIIAFSEDKLLMSKKLSKFIKVVTSHTDVSLMHGQLYIMCISKCLSTPRSAGMGVTNVAKYRAENVDILMGYHALIEPGDCDVYSMETGELIDFEINAELMSLMVSTPDEVSANNALINKNDLPSSCLVKNMLISTKRNQFSVDIDRLKPMDMEVTPEFLEDAVEQIGALYIDDIQPLANNENLDEPPRLGLMAQYIDVHGRAVQRNVAITQETYTEIERKNQEFTKARFEFAYKLRELAYCTDVI